MKWYLVTRAEFSRERDGEVEGAIQHFRSSAYRHLSSDEFNMHFLNEALQKLFVSKEKFIMKKFQLMYITNQKKYSPVSYPPTKKIESSSEKYTSSKCINNAQVV